MNQVSSISEEATPDILARLACAAARLGRMPGKSEEAAPVYQQLAEVPEQLGNLGEILPQVSKN